ncbi:MAG: 50S ribosomal protein L18 [Phycisphaerales bacterium]|nr:50S ribosomal protein L18 [Phycisphaerales bacterium]
MNKMKLKNAQRARRKAGLRKVLRGSPQRPRLSVYRSLQHIYVQVIDDLAGRTLAAASTLDTDLGEEKSGNAKAAAKVGAAVAERALKAGCSTVAFDRNGFRYHGRIKALADAARGAGLKF